MNEEAYKAKRCHVQREQEITPNRTRACEKDEAVKEATLTLWTYLEVGWIWLVCGGQGTIEKIVRVDVSVGRGQGATEGSDSLLLNVTRTYCLDSKCF